MTWSLKQSHKNTLARDIPRVAYEAGKKMEA